jgi:hypothetical protein
MFQTHQQHHPSTLLHTYPHLNGWIYPFHRVYRS